mmetsp:Transcript_5773/g.8027  ORF Transcript_5773/g.8027 Transcript_5773/m.8027 type:complete len:325 (+) Transcript_5773:171-1145(+)
MNLLITSVFSAIICVYASTGPSGRQEKKLTYYELFDRGLLPHVDIHGIGNQTINDRTVYVRDGITPSANSMVLEIAPLCAALFPQGPYVKNLDVQSREENIKKYDLEKNSWPKDLFGESWKEHFAEVHYIWKGGKYSNIIKNGEKFQRIVGSHVIEHIPDLISWLNDLYDLLLPGGEVRMLIPDMRFNWDHRRRPTELSDIIGNYLEQRQRPTFDTLYEQILFAPHSLNSTSRDLWNSPPYQRKRGEEFPLPFVELALQQSTWARDQSNKGFYQDAHVNRWSASAFAYQMNTLYQLKLVKFKVVNLYPPHPIDSAEFFVTLLKE